MFSYNHAVGPSVTGGHVYRGTKYAALAGKYVFGDFETRRVWALEQRDRKVTSVLEIGRAPDRIVSFGVDAEGEIYVVGFDQGLIYRLDFDDADPSPAPTTVEIVPTARDRTVDWRFTFDHPAASWAEPEFDDRSWKTGAAGFGTSGTPGGVVRTPWRTPDIWLRREFSLDIADSNSFNLIAHHDEDAEIYLDGVLAARLRGFVREYDEVSILPEARAAIRTGRNILAVHCHQTTGGQFIDVGIGSLHAQATEGK